MATGYSDSTSDQEDINPDQGDRWMSHILMEEEGGDKIDLIESSAEPTSNEVHVMEEDIISKPMKRDREEDDEGISTEECVNKLLDCQAFQNKGWKVYSATDVNTSYGVIRNVDLDLEEEEILTAIKCPSNIQIISVKRLQRRHESGWEPSEVVRIGFSGSHLPSFIYVDWLRTKVDPFVFPVTQCSKCWKFGHVKTRCPSNKIVCPKCTEQHNNCEVTTFKCVNCRGDHMALNRNCPVYTREKRVRELMAEYNCSYYVACNMYVKPQLPLDSQTVRQNEKPKIDSNNSFNGLIIEESGSSYKYTTDQFPPLFTPKRASSPQVSKQKKSHLYNKNESAWYGHRESSDNIPKHPTTTDKDASDNVNNTRQVRKNPTPLNFMVLKQKVATAQRLIRIASAESYRQFCDSIGETTSSSELWSRMRWLKGYRTNKMCLDEEKATTFLRQLTPDYVSPQCPVFRSINPQGEITTHELLNVLKTKDTAPGEDDISYSMFYNFPDKQLIIELFNKCLNEGGVPTQWRNIKVVPIPKPGRDPCNITSLRPISLISCILWKEYFDKRSEEKGIWYKTIQSEPPKIPWFTEVKMNRQLLVTCLRLRTGHIPMNAFGHLMKVTNSPNCLTCNLREDVYHALVECARIGVDRRELEYKYGINLRDVGKYV
ncbi:hypothetical protein HW555_005489 [Spodoptera exigua]|uniref:Reverse transcriptase n=1 Tax=Spodoptera exigua TaxID=7107 RepID=A0A835GJQ1_SPOEX|nr:hypothetical protein HW555_005489 [Spodoptera exigua]